MKSQKFFAFILYKIYQISLNYKRHSIDKKCRMSLIKYLRQDWRRSDNTDLTLAHRLRRWANIKPVLGERLVPSGKHIPSKHEILVLF